MMVASTFQELWYDSWPVPVCSHLSALLAIRGSTILNEDFDGPVADVFDRVVAS